MVRNFIQNITFFSFSYIRRKIMVPFAPSVFFLCLAFVSYFSEFIINGLFSIIISGLLALASQRVESLCYQLLTGTDASEMAMKERGSMPGMIESMIIVYVISKLPRF